jgi:hypothetical protein
MRSIAGSSGGQFTAPIVFVFFGPQLTLISIFFPSAQIAITQTAKDSGDRLTKKSPLAWKSTANPASATIFVDKSAYYQSIIGMFHAFNVGLLHI